MNHLLKPSIYCVFPLQSLRQQIAGTQGNFMLNSIKTFWIVTKNSHIIPQKNSREFFLIASSVFDVVSLFNLCLIHDCTFISHLNLTWKFEDIILIYCSHILLTFYLHDGCVSIFSTCLQIVGTHLVVEMNLCLCIVPSAFEVTVGSHFHKEVCHFY